MEQNIKIFLFLFFICSVNCASLLNQHPNYFQTNYQWNNRIVGGQTAFPGQFPYQISLRLVEHLHLCGGSIISNDWIVTAAHCTEGYNITYLSVVIGAFHYRDDGEQYKIDQIFVHPEYHFVRLTGDIALIRTVESLVFTGLSQPISIGLDFIGAGVQSISSGWGTTAVYMQNILC